MSYMYRGVEIPDGYEVVERPSYKGYVIGDYKISKLNDKNYFIEKFNPDKKDCAVHNKEKKYKRVAFRNTDGYYSINDAYFQSLGVACWYLLEKVLPAEVLNEGDARVATIQDFCDKMEVYRKEILKMFGEDPDKLDKVSGKHLYAEDFDMEDPDDY